MFGGKKTPKNIAVMIILVAWLAPGCQRFTPSTAITCPRVSVSAHIPLIFLLPPSLLGWGTGWGLVCRWAARVSVLAAKQNSERSQLIGGDIWGDPPGCIDFPKIRKGEEGFSARASKEPGPKLWKYLTCQGFVRWWARLAGKEGSATGAGLGAVVEEPLV